MMRIKKAPLRSTGMEKNSHDTSCGSAVGELPLVTTVTASLKVEKDATFENYSKLQRSRSIGERRRDRDEETQAAKAKLRQYEAMGHIKVEMDEPTEDSGDGQSDDGPTTMVIPFSTTTLSQEGGCYGSPVPFNSGQPQLIMSQNPVIQPRVGGMVDVPILTDLEGKYGFTVSVDDKERSTKSPMWLMSPIVNKLYTNLNKAVPFEARMKNPPTDIEKLSVRAILVFSSPEFLRTNVTRCPNHAALSEPTNHDFPYPNHVVRADHPEAVYQESPSGRLSVVVPFDVQQNGLDYALILLRFMCLGSCVGGISRRPISIVFSLENGQGEVLGRKVIDVRVCACPTRDIRTDEQAVSNRGIKRKGSQTQTPQIIKKKPKMLESKLDQDDESLEVFTVKVHGRQLYSFVVNMMHVYYSTHPEYALRYPDPTITVSSSLRQRNTGIIKERTNQTDIIEESNNEARKSGGSSPIDDGNLVIDSEDSLPHSSSSSNSQQLQLSIPSSLSLMVNGLDSPHYSNTSKINSVPQLLSATSPISVLPTSNMGPFLSTLNSARPQLATARSDNTSPASVSFRRHVPVMVVPKEPYANRLNTDTKQSFIRQPLVDLKSPTVSNTSSVPTTSVTSRPDLLHHKEESSHDSEEMLVANVLATGFTKKSRKLLIRK